MPGKRQAGCRFLLDTSLLDKQKRSISAAGGGRKPAAGEHGREWHRFKQLNYCRENALSLAGKAVSTKR